MASIMLRLPACLSSSYEYYDRIAKPSVPVAGAPPAIYDEASGPPGMRRFEQPPTVALEIVLENRRDGQEELASSVASNKHDLIRQRDLEKTRKFGVSDLF